MLILSPTSNLSTDLCASQKEAEEKVKKSVEDNVRKGQDKTIIIRFAKKAESHDFTETKVNPVQFAPESPPFQKLSTQDEGCLLKKYLFNTVWSCCQFGHHTINSCMTGVCM